MSDCDSDNEILASLLATASADDENDNKIKKKSETVAGSQQLKFNPEPDSDDELLATLLGSEDDDSQTNIVGVSNKTDASQESTSNSTQSIGGAQSRAKVLKELEYNFLDDISDDVAENKHEKTQTLEKEKKNSASTVNNADSSDEEDSKYFEQQRYSEYGKQIKHMIKTQETEKQSLGSSFTKENSFSKPAVNKDSPSLSRSFKTKVKTPQTSRIDKPVKESDKYSLQVTPKTSSLVKKDVYSDPIFGIRVVKPLVSSTELVERMQGRKPVTVSGVKLHLLSISSGKSQEDWVIAGVVITKSAVRTSVKGSQFIIWKISDLTMEMNCVSVFLFSGAYKELWKLPTGTVVGILNPSIMESKDNKDFATLSVDNAQKVMILGLSKDLSKCKSMKKNGEPCTAPVNLRLCEYCVYHVKQEYGKFSKRNDIQSQGLANTLGRLGAANGPAKKANPNIYQQRNQQPFVAVLAKRNEAQFKKDEERLAMLKGNVKPLEKSKQPKKIEEPIGNSHLKVTGVELSAMQMRKDLDRLNKLRGWGSSLASPSSQQECKPMDLKSILSPKLGRGAKGGIIDFSEPTPQLLVNKAKLNAIEYVKRFGSFKKTNPNQTRPSKEILSEKGEKRRREEEDDETVAEKVAKKELIVKNRFQEMLEKKSAHSDLIERHEDEETEMYFRKQLAKERMEEKMLTTYQVACKAVQCKICNYVAFSSSDMCKKLQHPIKVFNAVKRFFKCGDCGNRTVSLDRIPLETCKRCSSSKWMKTAMMDEKRTQLPSAKLSIRGAEEAYIGADVTGENLDLLVPDNH